MTRKTNAIVATAMAAILIVPSIGMAYAEGTYFGSTGSQNHVDPDTFGDMLKLQSERVRIAQNSADKGSGTPLLDPDGSFGSLLISGALFGGVAAALFVKSRGGRYAAS